jgi:hypothetical protein
MTAYSPGKEEKAKVLYIRVADVQPENLICPKHQREARRLCYQNKGREALRSYGKWGCNKQAKTVDCSTRNKRPKLFRKYCSQDLKISV